MISDGDKEGGGIEESDYISKRTEHIPRTPLIKCVPNAPVM